MSAAQIQEELDALMEEGMSGGAGLQSKRYKGKVGQMAKQTAGAAVGFAVAGPVGAMVGQEMAKQSGGQRTITKPGEAAAPEAGLIGKTMAGLASKAIASAASKGMSGAEGLSPEEASAQGVLPGIGGRPETFGIPKSAILGTQESQVLGGVGKFFGNQQLQDFLRTKNIGANLFATMIDNILANQGKKKSFFEMLGFSGKGSTNTAGGGSQ